MKRRPYVERIHHSKSKQTQKLQTKRKTLKVTSGRCDEGLGWQSSTNFKECTQMSFTAFSFVVAAVKFKLLIFFFLYSLSFIWCLRNTSHRLRLLCKESPVLNSNEKAGVKIWWISANVLLVQVCCLKFEKAFHR